MRRIGRILRHPATATACLLLSGAAWVAQFARTRNVYWISPGCSIEVGYGGGGLWVWAAERGTFELLGSGFHAVSGSPRRYVPEFRIDRGLEITTDYGSPSSIVNGVYAHMPAWIAATALLVPPVIVLARRRPRRAGHCACGYSLAGLTDDTCPECGRMLDTSGERVEVRPPRPDQLA